ncbi:hypothetical protein U1E44_01405 [Arenibacter sp. GZD96]|uniref:hypothetical protein n=1 Tax=Aurantibrevibacter litoralis TaxID=3106030 RepID=UPI002AFF9EB6|nr:hypothetical protein [Arenibacter sp. GZD-96]MEA1784735.1 hypothetical protein [Arenibacter sp. GZD-96]
MENRSLRSIQYIELTKMVSEFFEIIEDPRNISPPDFNYFCQGTLSNENFENIQKIDFGSSWNGYKKLRPLIVNLLIGCEYLNYEEFQNLSTYYITQYNSSHNFRARYILQNNPIEEKEKYELYSAYTAFFFHIKTSILDQMNDTFKSKKPDLDNLPEPKKEFHQKKTETFTEVGILFAQGLIFPDPFKKEKFKNKVVFDNIEWHKVLPMVKYLENKTNLKNLYPYINNTLKGTEESDKNLLLIPSQIKKVMKECVIRRLSVTHEFKALHDNL